METTPKPPRRGWEVDAAWYAASAVFAWLVMAVADVPLQRSWGRVAVWTYLAAAPVAFLSSRTTLPHRARVALAAAVMAGAAGAPLVLAVSDRSSGDRGATAQSEVLIVEEAATSLARGRDPYAASYDRGPLAGRPAPTRAHVPYPPGMLVFGLPKAVAGAGPGTDARVWFLLASLTLAVPAIRRMRTDEDGRLLVFQVLFALPTGAMLIATGGHDLPVLAALLASFVLLDAGRPVASGLGAGAALALRQTSVLALPFLLAIAPRERRLHQLVTALLPPLVLSLPFLLWDAGAFVEDAVRFPLGLGTGPSAARTPTLGRALVELAPAARTPITIVLVVAIAATTVALVTIRPPTTMAGACVRAAGAYAAAFVLAPAARFGYVVYPLSLVAWAVAFSRGDGTEAARVPAQDVPAAKGR